MRNKAFDHSKYQHWIDPNKVIPYERNAKIHDDKQVENICTSIRRFGWQQDTVLTSDNVLVIGHGRRLAALKLGCEMPYHVIDKTADELTDEDIRELRIADNQTNAETGLDYEILKAEISDLEFDEFDFEFGEFNIDIEDKPIENNVVEDNYNVELPDAAKAKRGDIWQLGKHRLMCGDSTNFDDVERLLDGCIVDLVVTDPPYNMNYEGAGNTRDRKSKKIMNDHMGKDAFRSFLVSVFSNYYSTMRDGASIYVFYKELGEGVFITSLADGGLTYKQMLVWVKNQIVLGGSKYQSMYEPFLMGCKGDTIKVWNGRRRQRSVIETIDLMSETELRDLVKQMLDEGPVDVVRCRKQLVNDLHPTMKPVRLIAKLVENSSNAGDCVCDLFGGSGTTLIACEQLGRKCCVMELDPRYVDVIIERYEIFTGQKAVLLNG